MIEQLRARWRRLTPEQRMALGIGVPAVAGAALYQRLRARGEPEPDTEAEPTDTTTATMLGYDTSTGADAGSLAGITESWNDALAALTGQIESVGEQATSAAEAAAQAQAAAEAAQAAAEAAGEQDTGEDTGTGTGTGTGFVAGAQRCTGGRYGWGFQYDNLKNQDTLLTRRIVALRARIATLPAGQQRRNLRAQIAQLRARRTQVRIRMRAWRQACRAARQQAAAGGPTDITAAAYAPGLVVVGPSMGAGASMLSAPVGSPTYTPPTARRAGVTWGRR